MSGKFILSADDLFIVLKENEVFYTEFFKVSFNYQLNLRQDYAYLISSETNENLSRDISIFMAILSYELDRDGRNFMEMLEYHEFALEEIDRYFENTSFIDLVESNKQLKDSDSRKSLINSMARRNIVHKAFEDRFTFTPAHKVFVDFAKELAIKRMQQDSYQMN